MGPNEPIAKKSAAFRDGAQQEATSDSSVEQLNCLASDYLELGKSKPHSHKLTNDKPQMTNASQMNSKWSKELKSQQCTKSLPCLTKENVERSNEDSNMKDPPHNESEET